MRRSRSARRRPAPRPRALAAPGSRRFRSDRVQPAAALDLAWDLGDRLVLGADVTYAWRHVPGLRLDEIAGGLALTGRLPGAVELFGEVVRRRTLLEGARASSSLLGGAAWRVTRDLQLDASVGADVGDGSGHSAGLGIGVRF